MTALQRRWIWVASVVIVLSGALLVAGCGGDGAEVTTTAAPATTTNESTATTGGGDTTTTEAATSTSETAPVQHEPVELILQSYVMGSSAYTIFFALSELINEHSEWLSAVAVESGGNVENVELLQENQENMIIHSNVAMFYQSRAGVEPFRSAYTYNIIARSEPFSLPMLTFNDKIKSYADLKGKAVNMLMPGSSAMTIGMGVLQHHGITQDDFRYVAAGFDKGKDDLLDGTIDATTQSLNFDIPPGVTPPIEELWASGRPLYCLELPQGEEEAVQKIVQEETGAFLPFDFSVIPQSEHPNFVNDWHVINGGNFFGVSAEMDPEIVKEVLRILHEYKDEFPAYFEPLKHWTLEGFVDYMIEPQYWHPAALEFWKDLGVEPSYVEPQL